MAKTPRSSPSEPEPVPEPEIPAPATITQPGTSESGTTSTNTPASEDLSRQINPALASKPTTIRLDQIDRETQKRIYCHRTPEELTDDHAKILADSLISEGQVTPIEYYRDDAGRAILVRGYRTIEAHHQIIGKQLDQGHFKADMEIPAVELTGGSEVDYLLRAITSNEVRKHLSEEAKYTVATLLLDRNVTQNRAARAMGISTTLYRRYVRRHTNQWIQQYVKDDYIGLSDADDLLEAAETKDASEELKRVLVATFAEIGRYIAYIQKQAKVTREKLSPKAVLPKTYVQKAKVKKTILESIKKGTPIVIKLGLEELISSAGSAGTTTGATGVAEVVTGAAVTEVTETETVTGGNGTDFTFECTIGEKDGKLKVRGLNGITLSQLSHEDLAAIACKLNLLAKEVMIIHKTKQAERITRENRKTSTLDNMAAFYDEIGEHGMANTLRAQIAPAGNGKGNGNGASVPRAVKPIAANINIPAKS